MGLVNCAIAVTGYAIGITVVKARRRLHLPGLTA